MSDLIKLQQTITISADLMEAYVDLQRAVEVDFNAVSDDALRHYGIAPCRTIRALRHVRWLSEGGK